MIDISTLSIGSHVLFDGERVEIEGISIVGVVYGVKATNDEVWYHPSEFAPIPITEELLTELGFEKLKDPQFKYAKRYKDNVGLFVKIITDGVIRIEAWDKVILRGNLICRHLHELEAFIFLTTKQN